MSAGRSAGQGRGDSGSLTQQLGFATWDQCLGAREQLQPHETLALGDVRERHTGQALADPVRELELLLRCERRKCLFASGFGRHLNTGGTQPERAHRRNGMLLRFVGQRLQTLAQAQKPPLVQRDPRQTEVYRV